MKNLMRTLSHALAVMGKNEALSRGYALMK